jgi:hypothetical protein
MIESGSRRTHVLWSNEDESILLLRALLEAWDADDEDATERTMVEVAEFLMAREDSE